MARKVLEYGIKCDTKVKSPENTTFSLFTIRPGK
jgi:hypothetical protein